MNKLIELAQLNIIEQEINGRERFFTWQYAALRRAADNIYVAPGVPASEFFSTHENGLPAIAVALRKRASEWPKSHRPTGLILITADKVELDQKCIEVKRGLEIHRLDLHGNVHRNPSVTSKVSPPYLVLAQVAETSRNPGRFEPVSAYMQPIYSKQIMAPVTRDAERDTLRVLLRLQQWWAKKRNTPTTIESLALNDKVDDGDGASFVISAPQAGADIRFRIVTVEASTPEAARAEIDRRKGAAVCHVVLDGATPEQRDGYDSSFARIATARLLSESAHDT